MRLDIACNCLLINMDFNTEFSKENLLELYSSNKDLVVPILSIVISASLFLFVIFPQLISFSAKKSEADLENIKLSKMQETYDMLSKLDENVVDSNIKTAQKALPDKKDFESILTAISTAAGNSSTQIIDYTYQASSNNSDKYPTILFKIQIIGGAREAVRFTDELYRTYPLADVTSIVSSDSIDKLDVSFYYKAFPYVTVDDRTMVGKMSKKQEDALKTISGWTNTESVIEIPTEASASSSTPF